MLLAATLAALLWANSAWSESYEELWATQAAVSFGGWELSMDLEHWVNDGLMALFFFVIGLEVRREFSVGELTQPRRAAIPVLAAVGGLVVPALIYVALAPGGEAGRAWGLVIGTDTAFMLGALAVVGPRFATQLRIFLLTLTVIDDIVAVSVIGLYYSDSLDPGALVVMAALGAVMGLMSRYGVAPTGPYLARRCRFVVGNGAVRSARLDRRHAGRPARGRPPAAPGGRRACGAPVPRLPPVTRGGVRPFGPPRAGPRRVGQRTSPGQAAPLGQLRGRARVRVRQRRRRPARRGPAGRLGFDDSPGPWWLPWSSASSSASVWRPGPAYAPALGRLPLGVGFGHVFGGAVLSGIGFTVSLLIAGLALSDPQQHDQAVVGILIAAVLATVLGWVAFRAAAVFRGEGDADLPRVLDRTIDPAVDHIRGPVDAPLTLVEYGDYECPFCSLATGVARELSERFGDDLRFVFRQLPLADVHPHAELAAQAAIAAGAQRRFWEMHDLLFAHQDQLEYEDIAGYAADLDLDVEQFLRDLDDDDTAERVRDDVASAEASGARGTPTFFVGDHRHTGPHDTETLARALESSRQG